MYFDAKGFGKRVADLRKKKGMLQDQLAEQLNISVSHLAHIEYGQRKPSIDLMIDIAKIFEVSLDYLILGKESAEVLKIYRSAVHEAIRILSLVDDE